MKVVYFLAIVAVFSVAVFAQDKPMDMKTVPKGEMKTAKPIGAHDLVMAHEHNALAFTKILLDMTADGKIADIELARAAFADIKRSVGKMDEIRLMHVAKMDPAMKEKMKSMLDGMASDSAALNGHVDAIETALQGTSPRVQDVEAHAAALLLRLKKMIEPEKKMDMPDKTVDVSGMKMDGDGKMDHHKMVMVNSEKAMGFSQTATTHHFLMAKDGGTIQVEANEAKDTASRDMIRAHLTEIAKQFKSGDFATPFAVHGVVPTGVPEMQKAKDKIMYMYEETDKGARVRIMTNDPQALAAIHAFLKFQIEDHQTGDPIN